MEPGSVIVRIKLRYDTIDIFVEKYAINVGRTAVFLPTKSTREVGSEVRFELRIANDKPALVGIGKVLAVRAFDAKRPTATFGMVVELTRITKDSRSIVQRMLDVRKQRGLDDMALPIPSSAAAAQRPVVESTGVQEIPLPAPLRDSAPMISAAVRPSMARIEQAARSLAANNERFFADDDAELLRSNVDVPSALALARKLAASGAGLDADLLALQQSVSVPLAIDIDEASAQLAQVLGGVAVKRQQRSAGWAIPPRITTPATAAAAVNATPEPSAAAAVATTFTRGKGPTSPPPGARPAPGTVPPAVGSTTPPSGARPAPGTVPPATVTAASTATLAVTPAGPRADTEVAPASAAPLRAEPAGLVFATDFQAPPPAELDDDFAPVLQAAAPDEPTQIGEPIPRPPSAAALLISDDMDLNALAEHTDFSALGPPTLAPMHLPADESIDQAPDDHALPDQMAVDEVAVALDPADDEAIEIEADAADEAVEIEADAADEWIQGQPTVMGALDANMIAGAYRDPVVTPPPRAESEFDFSEIANTLRRRASTAPPVQNRTFAHTLPASSRTNRHITSRNTAQPATRPLAAPLAWGSDDAAGFDAPPVTVLAPDISARLSAIDADDDSDFLSNGPLTHAERPVLPTFQPAAPPASPSLDDALLSMSNEDEDDDEFFFEAPQHLPRENPEDAEANVFSSDSPSITSAAPIVQGEDDIPIEMDFEILAEFEDDGTK